MLRNYSAGTCRLLLKYYKYKPSATASFCGSAINFVKKDDSISQLITPVPIKPGTDDINVGAELTGTLDKAELLKMLNTFTQRKEIRASCMENGLDGSSFLKSAISEIQKLSKYQPSISLYLIPIAAL